MKPTCALTRALAIALQAGAMVAAAKQEISSVEEIIQSLLDGFQKLDKEVLAYSGGKPEAVCEAAKDLLKKTQTGLNDIQEIPDLSIREAIGLKPLAADVNQAGETFLRDLVSTKWEFKEEKLCNYLHQYSNDLSKFSVFLLFFLFFSFQCKYSVVGDNVHVDGKRGLVEEKGVIGDG
ncbi:hypothetical protein F4775DRAFT_462083 [Biscogniauxia sp. FL1348]|nr:hypothetical protein F4775DRAFT_462083 [Biscogniauxia sp. FL1348]